MLLISAIGMSRAGSANGFVRSKPPYSTFTAGLTVPGVPLPIYPNIPAGAAAVKPTSSPGFDWNNDKTPYVLQYNLNVQRQLKQNTVLTVGYVGSRGIHLLTEEEQNPELKSMTRRFWVSVALTIPVLVAALIQ